MPIPTQRTILLRVICGNWEDVSEILDYGDIVELNRAWMSASVQAIANQRLRHSPAPSEFAQKFNGRIQALARANSMLRDATWQCASLRNLLRDQLQLGTIDEAKLQISAPDVDLDPQSALHLALVIHELDTNANKYGALSIPAGMVNLSWTVENGTLHLTWAEKGGPAVSPPSRKDLAHLRSRGASARMAGPRA